MKKAQDYFELSSECDTETEQEEKRKFAEWAIAELEEGVIQKEEDSIYCMMEFYKDGLGSVVKRDMEKYAALKKLFQEERDKNLIQRLQSKNHELETILEELIATLVIPGKANEIQRKVREANVSDLLKGEEEKKQQALLLIGRILHEAK